MDLRAGEPVSRRLRFPTPDSRTSRPTRARIRLDGLTGIYDTDASVANRALGLRQTPPGRVWHHVEDGTTMILIPRDLHAAIRHTGGSAVIRHGRPPAQ